MLTQMVELLIQQEPTLLAQRTVDTRRYIMDQWDRTHRAPIDENALAVFLYDETHSSLPEEQKIFAREKGAEVMLGKLYLTGQGVTHDQAQAMDWFSRSAAQGNRYAQFFLEHQNYLRPPSVMLAATRLLYHMSRIFEDHALPQSSAGLHVDRKLRRRIQEKKIAMGHKPDDHEEEQNQGGMIMGGM